MSLKIRISLICIAIVAVGCETNNVPCGSVAPQSAVMPVEVDWSLSGLSPLAAQRSDTDVYRMSLRFFPKDGGDVFERYLDEDLEKGEIEIPVGRYSVVTINESVEDSYWVGSVEFVDIDDFENFAAELNHDDDYNATEPKPIAAWSVTDFEVTENMATLTRGVTGIGDSAEAITLSQYEQEQMVALTKIVMMPRTRSMSVKVTTENLGSVQSISSNVTGYVKSVNIVSGDTYGTTMVHSVELSTFEYSTASSTASRADEVSSDTDGVASGSILCFSHDGDTDSDYTLDLELYMVDGSKYEDDEQLSSVDVGDHVTSTDDSDDYLIEHSISLPEVTGGDITVDEWESNENIELN